MWRRVADLWFLAFRKERSDFVSSMTEYIYDRQCTYNVTTGRISTTIVAVEKQ
jgi:hypothetical protein